MCLDWLSAASLASTGKYKVRGLVRNLEKAKEALSPGGGGGGDDLEIELKQGDILDEASLGAAMKVRETARGRLWFPPGGVTGRI